jgi:hypothetical protein
VGYFVLISLKILGDTNDKKAKSLQQSTRLETFIRRMVFVQHRNTQLDGIE